MRLWKIVSIARRLWSFRKCQSYGGKAWLKGRLILNGNGIFKIGYKFRTEGTIRLTTGENGCLEIKNHVFFNNNVGIAATTKVVIGNNVKIGNDALLMDSDFHDIYDTNKPGKSGPIIIEDDVWIAMKAVILKNVTIGKGSVIGACAVVTKDVPPYSLVAGNPAKVIKSLKS